MIIFYQPQVTSFSCSTIWYRAYRHNCRIYMEFLYSDQSSTFKLNQHQSSPVCSPSKDHKKSIEGYKQNFPTTSQSITLPCPSCHLPTRTVNTSSKGTIFTIFLPFEHLSIIHIELADITNSHKPHQIHATDTNQQSCKCKA